MITLLLARVYEVEVVAGAAFKVVAARSALVLLVLVSAQHFQLNAAAAVAGGRRHS